MGRIIRSSVACLCLTLCLNSLCFAKEWRGIVPLGSTRADVVQLLGRPQNLLWDYRDYFILDDEWVTFQWIDPTCKRRHPIEPDSEVRPDDLVLSITVTPKKPFPQDALRLPANKLYFISCIEGLDGTGGCTVMDDEEGFGFTTSKEGVTSHSYFSPAKKHKAWMQEHSACQTSR